MRSLNLALRFALELCALGALAYWGFHTGAGAWAWLLGLGSPLCMAVLWGLFVAPKAQRRLGDPIRLGLELLIFGAAAAALVLAGLPVLGLLFATITTLNLALLFLFDQRRY